MYKLHIVKANLVAEAVQLCSRVIVGNRLYAVNAYMLSCIIVLLYFLCF